MDTIPDVNDLKKAIEAARRLQAEIHERAKHFPPHGKQLAEKLRSAADRTVLNLELALEALEKDIGMIH